MALPIAHTFSVSHHCSQWVVPYVHTHILCLILCLSPLLTHSQSLTHTQHTHSCAPIERKGSPQIRRGARLKYTCTPCQLVYLSTCLFNMHLLSIFCSSASSFVGRLWGFVSINI